MPLAPHGLGAPRDGLGGGGGPSLGLGGCLLGVLAPSARAGGHFRGSRRLFGNAGTLCKKWGESFGDSGLPLGVLAPSASGWGGSIGCSRRPFGDAGTLWQT